MQHKKVRYVCTTMEARLRHTTRHHREREREKSIFLCGYRYALQDQDTTWPAAYELMRRGYDERGVLSTGGLQVWSF